MSSLTELSSELKEADFESIPIMYAAPASELMVRDLADASSRDPTKRRALAAEIRRVCLNEGFFYVKNHAVDESTVDEIFHQSQAFFALLPRVKDTVDISKSNGNFRGYMAILTENNDPTNKGEVHEAFNLGLDPSLDPKLEEDEATEGELKHSENLWPSEEVWKGADAFRDATLQYYSQVLALGQSLFPLFALALDMPEDFFEDKTRRPAAVMRLLHYPAMGIDPIDELTPGIGAHTDFECFTILRQDDVPALQVQNKAGQWINAKCIPGTFIINIGDQFARWTNDIFVSTRHRALPATTKARYSIPFFFGCDHEVPLVPPASCVTKERPARYPVITAGAYVHQRLSEVYAGTKAA